MGRLEDALRIADRAGKRALDVAEELGFEQRFGERAAVDRARTGGADRLPC